mgnify:CR=1 FL=1
MGDIHFYAIFQTTNFRRKEVYLIRLHIDEFESLQVSYCLGQFDKLISTKAQSNENKNVSITLVNSI